jgi:hypothetical protein
MHVQYWFNQTTVPCGTAPSGTGGRLTLVSDPLGGGFTVLDAKYLQSDQTLYLNCVSSSGCPGFDFSDIGITWPSLRTGPTGLPYGTYIETTFYLPTATMNSRNPGFTGAGGGTAFLAINSSTTTSTPPLGSQAHFAVDQFEIIQNYTNSGATSWSWGSGLGVYGPGGFTDSSPDTLTSFNFASGYHSYGHLTTTNETNTVSICDFIDGTLDHCDTGPSGYNLSSHSATTCSGGGFSCYFGQNSVVWNAYLAVATCAVPSSTSPCYSNDLHEYLKSIRIFTCSGYKTMQCPGPIITSSNASLKHYANDNSPEDLIKRFVGWLRDKAA